jgi:hypothetical protein
MSVDLSKHPQITISQDAVKEPLITPGKEIDNKWGGLKYHQMESDFLKTTS